MQTIVNINEAKGEHNCILKLLDTILTDQSDDTSLEDVLGHALDVLTDHPCGQKVRKLGIFIRDPKTEELKLTVQKSISPDYGSSCCLESCSLPLSISAVSKRKTRFGSCPNCFTDPAVENFETQHFYSIPIIAERHILGTLVLCVPASYCYGAADIAILERFCQILGLLILSAQRALEISKHSRLLATSNDRHRELLSVIEDHTIFSRTDTAGRIVDVNDALVEISGYSRDELIGAPHSLLNSGHHDPPFWHNFWRTIASGQTWRGEICNRTKTGELYWVDSIVAPLRGADNKIENYISVRFEITERKAAQKRIECLAYYDTLTGLPNRAHTIQTIQKTLDENGAGERVLALYYLDLDRFKDINDKRGHAAGDQVLATVASRLKSLCPEKAFLGRLGSDEFAVICDVATRQEALQISERFQTVLQDPIQVSGERFALGLSIGIAFAPFHASDADSLLSRADMAMYQAKTTGAGSVLYSQSMADALLRRQLVSDRLKHALDAGAFYLAFQPQVHLADEKFSGCEVLLRWRDDELGNVSPAEFIPIAEELGLMDRLGVWVISETCRHIIDWASRGLFVPGRLALNISAQELMSPNYVGTLQETLGKFGCDPGSFELEITEHGLMRDIIAGKETLINLEELGFRIAIDDFGTGYSSLSYVKHFAANQLKIDLSFVRDMMIDQVSHDIVAATVAMSEKLGMETVAEGVETKEQADALKAMNCPIAQGYYYSRPLGAQEFEETWLMGANSPA
ncbi:PAS domain S-box-containing protein/diguanylate cyclase (GGDEF)-like protein [Roseibium hamelinense]|uniref:PAS domain S-box-containing protein/diguanylate cyclase (GGDEF)-like protein n=1 Tax=Roseibium hamelinense TaxID=150831 RepID=A0A562THT7_9HYPH|nr:EAL domain-containing protein [Roseibium hamelinense]MTI45609.1 EAL domain-containing protein [Roseibium hamelinense]TWI93211.1 PAS domain S-box-containing protein/diguanylate cyclase (GGDEF)-like protein [Roseibium hamelinense]